MHIRQVTGDERLTTSFPLQVYAFGVSPIKAEEVEKFRDRLPYSVPNTSLIAQDTPDGEALAAVSGIPMRQNVRGTVYPMAGLAGVVTHPLARRRGYSRALLIELLGRMRDDGHIVSALYPFRSSFYGRFGYIGLPKARTVTFSPAELGDLVRVELPGEVTWQRVAAGYTEYRDFTHQLLAQRHGLAVFPDVRAQQLADDDDRWLALARVDGVTVGALTYRIDGHGGALLGDDLLSTGPLGRALLLRFLARHTDQVARVITGVDPADLPELWATDLDTHTEAQTGSPDLNGPMARVLSVTGLAGLAVGPGRVVVEIVDDPFIAGRYRLDGEGGTLHVQPDPQATPDATLTSAGFAGLVYGVLDPIEVVIRGLGTIPPDAAGQLGTMFPGQVPYLLADF